MTDRLLEVVDGGVQSTVQDYPGRRGLLAQGFNPAGPMDHFAFRAANLLVGNPPQAAGLEITLGRIRLGFNSDAVVAACGAPVDVLAGGEPAPLWQSFRVKAGDELRLGLSKGPGFRVYLAVSGGIAVPEVLGSRATYTMGALGGLDGRPLKKGDVLPLDAANGGRPGLRFRPDRIPEYSHEWEIETMRGPQADPDFLTGDDLDFFFSHVWAVDHNSNRSGLRLEAHRFNWARTSGGIAGGHPSNVLDDGYPGGAVNMNGDTPVILGPDGPTAGGFVVLATVTRAGYWKIGQVRPGVDKIRFKEVTIKQAVERTRAINQQLTEASLEEVRS